MDLVKPDLGLIFWMVVVFLIIFWLLAKFAWKPILASIKDRERSIDEAIGRADKAREEMKELQASNEKILIEARRERDHMIKETRETKETIIIEAKSKAKEEADRMLAQAREAIHNEKMAAITELKNQVATLSIEIAERILKEQLSGDEKQKSLVNSYVKDINLN